MTSNAIAATTVVKPAEKVIWSRIDNEAILLNLHNGYYYTVNAVGCDIWKYLDGKQTVGDIVRLICDTYDVSPSQAESDLLTLLHECLREELITIVA